MRILVDADACPVRKLIEKIADDHKAEVILFVDTSHAIGFSNAKVIMVDKQRDSVDIKLVNHIVPGDVVVTQDYGLAAMALGKGAKVLNQDGLIFTKENIDKMLFERHIGQRVRRAGKRTKGPRRRTASDDIRFEQAFKKFI